MQKFIKKLIERLEELKELHAELIKDGLEEDYHSGCEGMCVDIIEIVNELAEEYKGGWIPCSERLPKDDSNCIVTVELSSGAIVVGFGWFDRVGVCWYVGAQELRTTNALAWQPLPAPFKEGE